MKCAMCMCLAVDSTEHSTAALQPCGLATVLSGCLCWAMGTPAESLLNSIR